MLYLTPNLAREYLEDNVESNRSINEIWVERLADKMRSGQWIANGGSLKFNEQGKMIDGYHRCWAVIKTGISVWTPVIFNCPSSQFMVVDDGEEKQ